MSLSLLPPGKTVEVIMLFHTQKASSMPIRKAPHSLYGKIRVIGGFFRLPRLRIGDYPDDSVGYSHPKSFHSTTK
jgi:hypothetical protein